MLEAYNVFDVIMGLLFILLGIFANDEPMRRVYRNKGVIVLSGIDGTGKFTHAQRIHEWLGQNGIPSKIIPFHHYISLDRLSKVRIKIKRGKWKNLRENLLPVGFLRKQANSRSLAHTWPY